MLWGFRAHNQRRSSANKVRTTDAAAFIRSSAADKGIEVSIACRIAEREKYYHELRTICMKRESKEEEERFLQRDGSVLLGLRSSIPV